MEIIASSSSSSPNSNDIVDSASASSDRPMRNAQFSKSPCMVPSNIAAANSWAHGGYRRQSLSQPHHQAYRRAASPPPPPPYFGSSQPFIEYYSPLFTCNYFPTLPPVYPYTPPPPISYCPSIELMMKILKQIDYYFSDDNLAKDFYLRSKMDDEGWVPVELIGSFKRVSQLTSNHQFILDIMRFSYNVEVHDGKLRRFGNWKKWLLPTEFLNRK